MASDFPPSSIRAVVQEVSALLKEQKATVSVAETAAGGLISASILATPGASAIYRGGITLYTLDSRKLYAGWTDEDVRNYAGATTANVSSIAEHVRKTLGSTYTIGESGAAGPTGGPTRNRMPGYAIVAIASEKGTETREVDTGSNDRAANMVSFAAEALTLLRDILTARAKI